MGILDFIRSQCIDVIEWTDSTNNTLVHKYDMNGKEIMNGAQLTVRESQVAIFVSEGQLADVFGPGRYELKTANLPLLTKIKSWKYGFNSPFKSDVYFINTRQFLDCKWGTQNPVMMRDSEFGMIRLRAFGSYAFRVSDPEALLKECFGTAKTYTVEDIQNQIKRTAVSSLSDAIAESKIPALDIAANYEELAEYAKAAINPKIANLGVELTAFVIENVSLPEEVEKAMDRRTSMGVVGDLQQYTQFQAAEALRESASNPGSAAGSAMGLGAGVSMGQMMAGALNFNNNQASQTQPAAAAPAAAAGYCANCGQALSAGAKFCPNCGQRQGGGATCPACGNPVSADAKFCPNCGQKL
ncbi:MAG: SPFH domain-containing protein [Clostridia bacterium]|nr:SPFH domain-containing protein [Clostridia bacterium]